MKNNNSAFSMPLFRENVKKLWPVSFVGFLICFLSGPLGILMNYNHLRGNEVRNALNSFNFGYSFVVGVLPAVTAILVFTYLHRSASVSVTHAMPFSRKSLFVTNWVSAWVMSAVPFILTALLLLVLRRPDVVWHSGDMQYPTFALQDIAGLVLNHLTIITFVLSVCVFAGIISGTVVIHFLTAGALNFLIPALYLVSQIYARNYIYGYTGGSAGLYTLSYMNPFFLVSNGPQGMFEGGLLNGHCWLLCCYYLALSFIISFLAFRLYSRRKLERAGESYVFGAAKWVILVLITFFSSTLLGIIINEIFGIGYGVYNSRNGSAGSLTGYLIGGLLGFIVGLMIVKKTTRVFNRRALLPLAVCAMSICLFIGGFRYDVLGISRRIPAASSVKNVYVDSTLLRYNYGMNFKDKDQIELVRTLQSSILDHKTEFTSYLKDDVPYTGMWGTITIEYEVGGGRVISRNYNVPASFLRASGELKQLVMSRDDRADVIDTLRTAGSDSIVGLEYEDFSYEYRNTDYVVDDYSPLPAGIETSGYLNINNLPVSYKLDVLDALAADLEALTYEQMVMPDHDDDTLGRVSLTLKRPIAEFDRYAVEGHNYYSRNLSRWMYTESPEKEGAVPTYFTDQMDVMITKDFTRTIELLKNAPSEN